MLVTVKFKLDDIVL